MTNGLNEWRDELHGLAKQKGWYDNEETELQFVTRCVANLHGEVSELWEAARNGSLHMPCDKNIVVEYHDVSGWMLTNLHEELADIIIRALDMAGRLNIDIESVVAAKHKYNATRPKRHGGKLA